MKYLLVFILGISLSGCRQQKAGTTPEMFAEVITEVRDNVLPFWMNYAVAPDGGFYGTVLRDGTAVTESPRGGVLNARILWSFSAAYRMFGDAVYLELANKSQQYFLNTFIDSIHGGVYWLVNPDGEILNDSKYTYAMTYGIYGLAEHYLATGNKKSLEAAIELFHTLENKGRDTQHDGYIESFTVNWEQLDQYDNNAPKTMNAHLHVMEAYTLLYECWKDDKLRSRLEYCTRLFMDRIYNPERKHFNLFFDNEWKSLDTMISYGHDIEAGWLLCDAARALDDTGLISRAEQIALDVTKACLTEGMTDQGYMAYEKVNSKNSNHGSWWGQVETILGCVNAWQISGDDKYLHSANTVWNFINDKMIDTQYGEWFSDCFDGEPRMNAPKVSMWRCPYHTVRLGKNLL